MWKLSEIEILEAKTKKKNCCGQESNQGPLDQKAKTLLLCHSGDLTLKVIRWRVIPVKTPLMTTPLCQITWNQPTSNRVNKGLYPGFMISLVSISLMIITSGNMWTFDKKSFHMDFTALKQIIFLENKLNRIKDCDCITNVFWEHSHFSYITLRIIEIIRTNFGCNPKSHPISIGRELDGFPVFQENFLRQGVKEFPFPESQLFKTLVTNFHHCKNYGEGMYVI